ncbi:TrbI/VirB10 family protein [Brevundimonas sp.]|uniref:TrbI/VirB10 family protein n=1 Tax=Brevundimonas sp. TaxID=1871086 RepID=UPI003D6D5B4B
MNLHVRDPRQGATEADIRPIVARQGRDLPIWLIVGGVALGGVLLFTTLDARRRALTVPTTQARAADIAQASVPLPPLYIIPDPPPPPAPSLSATAETVITPTPLPPQPSPQPPPSPFAPQPPPPNYTPPPWASSPPPMSHSPSRPVSSGAVLVIDATTGPPRAANANDGASEANRAGDQAIQSTRLDRRATTVPQGTLIPAVLETALDSTRPGHVRAIVSRDVTGFDGSRILIPRGTRLFGEYQADMAAGQRRALVQWTRLVRPDGVTVALASPAADIQGRAGIQGRVDNHFLARFGDALLQTTLNVGANLAGQSLSRDAPVVVALPGAIQGAGASAAPSRPQPTLRVDAGVRVTALVARDLEFPSGEAKR